MRRKERYDAIIDYFQKHNPDAETELNYSNPFELLVAVILSAQCTDKRINLVTPKLFEDFPTPEHLASSNFDELFPYIKSVSYPNNKTKHLLGMGKMLVEEFDSEIPSTTKELQKLPGVGRKTANVITSVIFDQPSMAVDTHVYRVSKRIGLVPLKSKTPLEVENYLIKNIPKEHIATAHHWLILHGRYICLARKPKCEECGIKAYCRYYAKNNPIMQ
ncbi:endonuclease III [Aureibacter tunicatorum]|uniref:Endonuclease III n=1 Tax=Aureibacter tunicatorum TaxID=866807 RepID=A0AAE4BR91_9BACT|nr:endonuclease III [Aureibacter tunicatorum]MDR6237520.1 endonuclease-3 [Aureibacter tunicatorum]BDD02554.1 endonuclease III [Aureibacter tunicatorum]